MSELENSIFVKVFRPISEKSGGGGYSPPSPKAARSLDETAARQGAPAPRSLLAAHSNRGEARLSLQVENF